MTITRRKTFLSNLQHNKAQSSKNENKDKIRLHFCTTLVVNWNSALICSKSVNNLEQSNVLKVLHRKYQMSNWEKQLANWNYFMVHLWLVCHIKSLELRAKQVLQINKLLLEAYQSKVV